MAHQSCWSLLANIVCGSWTSHPVNLPWASMLDSGSCNRVVCLVVQGQQSITVVADAFRSHVPMIAELAVASISGDVGQSARQVEALKNICACYEQLPKV